MVQKTEAKAGPKTDSKAGSKTEPEAGPKGHGIEKKPGESEEEFAKSLKELSDAEEKARKTVENARVEKDKILAEARAREQEILDDARKKAVSEKNAVIESGRDRVDRQCEKILREAAEEAESIRMDSAPLAKEAAKKLVPVALDVK
ncbi:MAG: hypothetical protein NTY90_03140 [Candidatus Micrarchaeota archaeon]|nr:hypothetical protein [Candidatus Micrarchaeota archaeon]